MKKSLLVVAFLTITSMSASAAAYIWSSSALNFDTTLLKSDASVNAYLIFLDSGVYESSYTVDENFSASSIGTVVSEMNKTSKAGRISTTFDFTLGTSPYGNGSKLGLLVTYDVGGEKYFNLSSDIQELTGYSLDGDSKKGDEYAFTSSMGTDPTLIAGGGWVKAVPEPATGALALAGLALLFRRKRA